MTITKIDKVSAPAFLRTFIEQNPVAAKLSRSAPVRPGRMRDRVEKILEALRSCQSTFQGYVALDGELIVGAVSYWPVPVEYFAQLYTSATDSWSRDPGECVTVRSLGSISAGAGSALMGAVEQTAKSASLPVLLRNTPESAGFYRKLGYQCRNGTCRKTFRLIESLLIESVDDEPLIEAVLQTVLVVDVQPAYAAHIYFDRRKLARKLRASKSVLVLYNGNQSGCSDDTEEDVSEFLFGPNGSQRAQYYDKGYAFFRDLMDNGVDDDFIIKLAQRMLATGARDIRELDPEDPLIIELKDEYQTDQDGCGFYIPEVAERLRGVGQVVVLGGGESECLAEVILLLHALRVPFTIDREFVY